MKNYNHALLVMEKHDYPAEAREAIIKAEEKILANEKANKIYESMYRAYWLKKKNFGEFSDKTKALAELIDEPLYTVYLVLLLNCTKPLLTAYRKAGISEEIYWTSVLDLKSKMLECKENYDIWGTFVEGWFMGFYKLERFGIGRFQFDLSDFGEEFYEENGIFIKEDEFCLGLHIPSHREPLTYEVRMDTYKKAFEFFKDRFDGKHIVICCNSWLLYPDNLNILPEKSNVCDFILDFQPLDIRQTYDFGDCWRIFNVGKSSLRPAELPRNTSMQRAYAEWFDQGKKAGNAYCILIFDGEKIVTRCDRETYRKKYGY
ncbi:MAG: acyltransferase domain-containing protein [Acutalibacteraceae bacterium]|nr:acyltransferase domain-containing protein [Acutalibacteraceae bacterium]